MRGGVVEDVHVLDHDDAQAITLPSIH